MRQIPFRPIPLWWRQSSFAAFRDAYAEQVAAEPEDSTLLLFVGSGLSMNAGLKNWAGLLCDLAQRHDDGLARSEEDKPLISGRVSEILAREDDPYRYLNAGSTLKAAYRDIEWRATLDDLLNGPQVREAQSQIHRALAHVPWRRIITTNYDCLIESAFRSEHGDAQKIRVFHPRRGDLHAVEHTTDRAVYKIHGDVADPQSTLVLAREDYDQLYQEGEVSDRFMLSLATLVRTSRLILFLGYGHNDPYLRDLWKFVRTGVDDANVFALMPIEGGVPHADAGALPEFEKSARALSGEGINVIGYSVDNGYAELGEFMEYLRDFGTLEEEYQRARSQQRPTVVMVYCGGTIGSRQPPDPYAPLAVNRQCSRFAAGLEEYKRKLLSWYHDFYHAGNDLPELDVVWEILPPAQQMFSENATPEHWTQLTRTVRRVVDKYIRAPAAIGSPAGVMPAEFLPLFEEDRRQFREARRITREGAAAPPEGAEELSERKFINGICNRYLMGIVMLGGTDTLAYSAAALSLGMQYLPCPVVLTGSSQPPSSTHLPVNQRGRYFTTSDAWRNLMTTLYFLQSFGHTLTEVFVCFADTVHHGVNLRKVATGGIPYARDPAGRRGGEHFTFRNLSYRSHYMFRMIDGLFCNNFYPRDGITFAALVGQDRDEFVDLRHVRPGSDRPSRQLETYGFSTRVWHLKTTPCAPAIDVSQMNSDALPWVVLLEGYTSGTYPSSEESPFAKMMDSLDDRGIPFVVTASFGLRPTGLAYETRALERRGSKSIPTLPLYGITEETALPLLCRIVDEIATGADKAEARRAWQAAAESADPTQMRIDLLKEQLDLYFRLRPNLITEELSGLTDRDKNIGRRDRLAAEARTSERIALHWDPRYGIFEDLKRLVRGYRHGDDGDGEQPTGRRNRRRGVIVSREGFTAMVDEIVRPFQRVGAAPDGFAVLSNIGFEMGLGIVGTIGDWSRTQYPLKRFRDQPAQEKADQLAEAARVLEFVANSCRNAGVAEVTIEPEVQTGPALEVWKAGDAAEWLRFRVRLERHDAMDWMHEKYAVVAFSQDDREFFRIMMDDRSDHRPLRAERERDEAFTDLLLNRWQHNLSGVDWFLLGLWKGVGCGIARALRFDSLAVEGRHLQPGHLRALRQAVRCEILFGNPHAFGLAFTYYAVGEQLTPAEPAPGAGWPSNSAPGPVLAAGTRVPLDVEIKSTGIEDAEPELPPEPAPEPA